MFQKLFAYSLYVFLALILVLLYQVIVHHDTTFIYIFVALLPIVYLSYVETIREEEETKKTNRIYFLYLAISIGLTALFLLLSYVTSVAAFTLLFTFFAMNALIWSFAFGYLLVFVEYKLFPLYSRILIFLGLVFMIIIFQLDNLSFWLDIVFIALIVLIKSAALYFLKKQVLESTLKQ